ncbi:hypothetical protein LMF32_06765 [Desemzia sp. C1]|uniref:hypothetical protein n=1 Tax=Desemzia sp. C1 TaxID=2892016 RepID=UPI001E510A93|nr:hypothetical protein [Desemzia sp. C1]MCI3028797.1 hypothetical protein [Desemzia sp. C1]
MLTLEEYISKRKREDKLNEFDLEMKIQNTQASINYVFEYFNQYLDELVLDEKMVLNEERLVKYKKSLRKFEPSVQSWLVNIYKDYDAQLNRSIVSYLSKDILFYLRYTDQDFPNISYEYYADLKNKYPFLTEQTEDLFLFIKDYHRINSIPDTNNLEAYISEEIGCWLKETWDKYHVNLALFASDYVNYFSDAKDSWDAKHKIKSTSNYQRYEYNYRQQYNLFNINSLYRKIADKPFMKGKKQELEILLMYNWLHSIEGDEDYWDEYAKKVLIMDNKAD